MEDGSQGSPLGKLPPVLRPLESFPSETGTSLKRSCSPAGPPLPPSQPRACLGKASPQALDRAGLSAEVCGASLRPAQESTAGTPEPHSHEAFPGQHRVGRGSPSLELAGQLVQDLYGLPVVLQLGVHQGRELAHLLNLQSTSQS